jgi:aminoglycoside phosphotransferase (APT) family kinase protein
MIRQLIATQAMINTLLPGLDEPVARLTGRLLDLAARGQRNYPRVLLHGDFSPDQILVSGTSVRIIDFDRVRTGESASDIGSFSAVEQIPCRGTSGPTAFGEQTERLIQGYRESGGQVLPARVAVWAAYRLFLGSVDPFRDRVACWPEETEWHIRRGLEMIP